MVNDIWAVPLQLSNFNIIVAVLGGFVSLFGLVSYLLKENFYLSEAREFRSQHTLDLFQGIWSLVLFPVPRRHRMDGIPK
jgi:hypothetical protein